MIHGKKALREGKNMSATITQYQQLAAEINDDLAKVAEKIQRLQRETPGLTENVIRAYVNVPVAFLQTAVAIADQEPTLQAAGLLDPEEGQDTLQFLDAFLPVHGGVVGLGKVVKRVLVTRKAHLAAKALQIYAVVRGMARNDPHMAEHARNLGRDLGPRGAKRKPKFTAAT